MMDSSQQKLLSFSQTIWKWPTKQERERWQAKGYIRPYGQFVGDGNPHVVPETSKEKWVGLDRQSIHRPTKVTLKNSETCIIDAQGKINHTENFDIPEQASQELKWVAKNMESLPFLRESL